MDKIEVFLVIGILFLVVAGFVCLPLGDMYQNSVWYYKRKMISFLAGALFFILCAVLLPSTKEAVVIYMLPVIVNNKQIQTLPENAMKFLNKKFEEWIDDMVKKKKK